MGGPLALLGRGTSRTKTPELEVAKQMERVEFLDHLLNPDTTFGGWGKQCLGPLLGFWGAGGPLDCLLRKGPSKVPSLSWKWGEELEFLGGGRWTPGSPPGKGLPEL